MQNYAPFGGIREPDYSMSDHMRRNCNKNKGEIFQLGWTMIQEEVPF